ncbi:MAG: type III PLP-dependent enzyme [Pseudomonadota bacterium]
MDTYQSAEMMLKRFTPMRPVVALRPHSVKRAAHWFLQHFAGKVLYAIKANNSQPIIEALYDAGIRCFDVASLSEIEQVCSLNDVDIYIMNPVKSRDLIAKAYFDFGVRNFALDCEAELEKINEVTDFAKDLNLFVRIACDNSTAHVHLNRKFGIAMENVASLLLQTRRYAQRLGLTFHIGSQAMVPSCYGHVMDNISALISHSGVLPDSIDIGGGFPSAYANMTPPALDQYMLEIERAFERMNVVETCELLCEPGRALVAEAVSAIVQVDLRKENFLYINDGAYGLLYDAAHYDFVHPVRKIDSNTVYSTHKPFSFYGPTCDSADFMPGPYLLPDNIGEGDFIEIGQLGAYAEVFRTQFNGYGQYDYVQLLDEPMLSLYQPENEKVPEYSVSANEEVS